MIFKGKVFIESWGDQLTDNWYLQKSNNGWTSDEIGLDWLQKVFLPSTFSRIKGKFRLLVLNGHGSHLTPKFDEICSQNDVIPICMPPHSSHLCYRPTWDAPLWTMEGQWILGNHSATLTARGATSGLPFTVAKITAIISRTVDKQPKPALLAQ